jgi:hypothetical protein
MNLFNEIVGLGAGPTRRPMENPRNDSPLFRHEI